MRLKKKKAIEITKELWTILAETGREYKWEVLEELGYGEMAANCPLCEYRKRNGNDCKVCPYYQKFAYCVEDESPYSAWCDAESIEDRKKYASLFLEQLKQL